MEPTIEELFDPKNITDEILFEGLTYPWELLPKLHGYLEKLAHGKKQGELYAGSFVDKDVNIGRGTARPMLFLRSD